MKTDKPQDPWMPDEKTKRGLRANQEKEKKVPKKPSTSFCEDDEPPKTTGMLKAMKRAFFV